MDFPLSLLDANVSKAIFILLQGEPEQASLWSLILQLRTPGQGSSFASCASLIYKDLKGLSSWITEAAFIPFLRRLGFCSLYLSYGHDVLLELFKYPIVLTSTVSGKRVLLSEPQMPLAFPPCLHDKSVSSMVRASTVQYASNCLEEFISMIQEHPMNVRFIFFCKTRPYIRAFHSLALLGSATAIWHLSLLPSQCLTAFYQANPLVTFKFPYNAFSTRSFSSLLQLCTSRGRLMPNNAINSNAKARITRLISIFRSKMKRLSHNLTFLKDKKPQSLLQSFGFDTHFRVFLDETGTLRHAPLPLSVHKITLYLMLYCKSISAFSILGKRNARTFHSHLFRFISQPMNGFMTLQELTSSISTKEFLLPATTVSKAEGEVRHHLLAYFVVYLMDFVILPALYQSFSAVSMHTELSNRIETANSMVPALLSRSLWVSYKNYLIKSSARLEIAATYEFVCSLSNLHSIPLTNEDAVNRIFWKQVSPGRLSFVYKSNGRVRPLCNFSFCSRRHRVSLNSFLRSALQVIIFELERPRNRYLQAHLAKNLGHIAVDYAAWLDATYTENPEAQIYMVTTDMITAFESVSVPRLLYYISHYIVTGNAYVVLTYKEIAPSKMPKIRTVALPCQHNGCVSMDSISRYLLCKETPKKQPNSMLCPMHARIYKREDIIKMLELHLLNPLVIHEGGVYRLTSGIPQGSVVSTVLFNCYSSLLHVQLLNTGIVSSRLFFYRTFVDDWLLLTTSIALLDAYIEYLNIMRDHGAYFRLSCFTKPHKNSPFAPIATLDCSREPIPKKSLYTPNLNQDMYKLDVPRYCGYIFLENVAIIDVLKWFSSTRTNGSPSYPMIFGSGISVMQRLRLVFKKRIRDLRCFIERSIQAPDPRIKVDGSILYAYIRAVTFCILCYTRNIRYSESLRTLLRSTFCSLKATVWRHSTSRAIFIHVSKRIILHVYGHNPRIRGLLLGMLSR
ncbi:Telomerase reverse transcriptase [Giardia duodenalis]|uniref:Telomerase reverse transcriptase n=1 Tax=Giardia intestinalis (strain ATCC 50803 / WB clone C6) TaxID=184922 RepID=A8B4E2_GIAIC|nr:Telomerase reverse transcriptase [Giardia intestinalis]KAE8303670.1 Telomerase reverse transcriptase [Giardia intestinalis]|eukprot:XP_001709571.1 Telomerase catalytic subunit [Giardia lamblia ATCC 50803]